MLIATLPLIHRIFTWLAQVIMQRLLHQSAALISRRSSRETHASCRALATLQYRHASAAASQHGPEPYDVVVFGGGMVGIAFAALLGARVPPLLPVKPRHWMTARRGRGTPSVAFPGFLRHLDGL